MQLSGSLRDDFSAKLNKCNYAILFPVIKRQHKATPIDKSIETYLLIRMRRFFCVRAFGSCIEERQKESKEIGKFEIFLTPMNEISIRTKLQKSFVSTDEKFRESFTWLRKTLKRKLAVHDTHKASLPFLD